MAKYICLLIVLSALSCRVKEQHGERKSFYDKSNYYFSVKEDSKPYYDSGDLSKAFFSIIQEQDFLDAYQTEDWYVIFVQRSQMQKINIVSIVKSVLNGESFVGSHAGFSQNAPNYLLKKYTASMMKADAMRVKQSVDNILKDRHAFSKVNAINDLEEFILYYDGGNYHILGMGFVDLSSITAFRKNLLDTLNIDSVIVNSIR